MNSDVSKDSQPRVRDLSVNGLVIRWQRDGDPGARDELVGRYEPLVRRLASRYAGPAEPFDDLVQVGLIGLLGAINRFDPALGVSFASFAVPTILGEIKRHFRNTGWSVHVPRGAQEMALRINQAISSMSAQTGRSPRVEEIAAHLSVTVEDALVGLEASAAHYASSLDAPVRMTDGDDELPLGETLGSVDSRLDDVETSVAWSAEIKRMPYFEHRALMLRLAYDMKQIDIARQLGCSQMHVSRLLRRAASQLRDASNPRLPERVLGP